MCKHRLALPIWPKFELPIEIIQHGCINKEASDLLATIKCIITNEEQASELVDWAMRPARKGELSLRAAATAAWCVYPASSFSPPLWQLAESDTAEHDQLTALVKCRQRQLENESTSPSIASWGDLAVAVFCPVASHPIAQHLASKVLNRRASINFAVHPTKGRKAPETVLVHDPQWSPASEEAFSLFTDAVVSEHSGTISSYFEGTEEQLGMLEERIRHVQLSDGVDKTILQNNLLGYMSCLAVRQGPGVWAMLSSSDGQRSLLSTVYGGALFPCSSHMMRVPIVA